MILDGELHPGIHRLGAHALEQPDRGLDVLFGRTRRKVLAVARVQAANQRRTHRFGHLDAVQQRLARGLHRIRSFRQYRPDAGLDVETELGGAVLHLAPVFRPVALGVERILQEHGIQLQASGVIEQLEIGPAHCPQAVAIEPDRNGRAADGCRAGLRDESGDATRKGAPEECTTFQTGQPFRFATKSAEPGPASPPLRSRWNLISFPATFPV